MNFTISFCLLNRFFFLFRSNSQFFFLLDCHCSMFTLVLLNQSDFAMPRCHENPVNFPTFQCFPIKNIHTTDDDDEIFTTIIFFRDSLLSIETCELFLFSSSQTTEFFKESPTTQAPAPKEFVKIFPTFLLCLLTKNFLFCEL